MPLKKIVVSNRGIGFAIIATTFLALSLASCQTSTVSVQSKENDLAAAGFVARPANTPARVAMLKRLPPNKFLMRSKRNTVNYVYADPINCNCLYVGTQKAFATYQATKKQARISDQQLLTAQTYRDPEWDWSGWGADFEDFQGPFGPNYGW